MTHATMQRAARLISRGPARRGLHMTLARKNEAPAPQTSYSPKVESIVESVAGLNLLEASQLVDALKERLNIKDIAMPMAAAAAAPAAAPAAEASEEAAEEAPKEEKKSAFNVVLAGIDAAAKAKVIREIKVYKPDMNLVDAKKMLDALPQTLVANASEEDAEKIKKKLEEVGATVKLE